VHENQCHGKLHLPQNISSLTAVFAHNNRGLSCPISGGGVGVTAYLPKQNLLLAGNRFSSPVPQWEPMHAAPAMYVSSEVDQWTGEIMYAAIGLPLLFCCLLAVYGRALPEFFIFKPDQGLEQFQWWSTKAIGTMSVVFLLVLVPLYAEGANLYECGERGLKITTITYLSDSPVIEWFVAVIACAAVVAQSFLLVATRHEVDTNIPEDIVSKKEMPCGSSVKIVLMWCVVSLLFSVPTVLYTLSTALPADNTLGLNATSLEVFNQAAAILLYLIVVIIGPFVAEWVVSKVTGEADGHDSLTTRMVLMTRLMVGVVVPTVVTILFNNECLGWWLYLWQPCADYSSSFDVLVQLKLDGHFDYNDNLAYFNRVNSTYQVTTHSQICDPAWKPQRCSRAVLGTVGNLILSKVALDAFLTPGAVMLMSMPFMTKTAERVWKRYCPDKEFMWYRGDVELSYILMFFEYTFIFGFIMPLILPFVVVALLMNCAVYRCAVQKLKLPHPNPVRPPFEYLYVARVIGIAYLMWFYLDNRLHGQLLVCIGVPISAIVADYVAFQVGSPPPLQLARRTALHTLALPLLDPDERAAENSDNPAQGTYHPSENIHNGGSVESTGVLGDEEPLMY